MHYTLKTPCKHCPFRTDIPAFLSKERANEIGEDVLYGSGSFPCHKTLEEMEIGDGVELGVTPDSIACAGALIFAEKCESWGQMMRIAMRLNLYDPDKLDISAPVFGDLDDFLAANDS